MPEGQPSLLRFSLILIYAELNPEGDYYDTKNSFIHLALGTNRKSLPLILVGIFVSIATRLGLDAHPFNYPGHVHAIIRLPPSTTTNISPSPEPSPEYIHVDVANSAVLSPTSLRDTLLMHNYPTAAIPVVLSPASTHSIIMRAARNITNSRDRQRNTPINREWERCASLYAALCLFVLEPQNVDAYGHAQPLLGLLEAQFPLDAEGVLMGVVAPALSPNVRERLEPKIRKMEDDELVHTVAVSRETYGIKHYVGMVFIHKKYG